MQSQARKFIDLLEAKQLLSHEVIAELRRQLAASKTKLSPELLARILVDNGHLTKFQASSLIADMAVQRGAAPTGPPAEELGFAAESEVVEAIIEDAGEETEGLAEDLSATGQVRVEEPIVEAVEVVPAATGAGQGASAARTALPLSSNAAASSPRGARPVKSSAASANPWDSFRIIGVGLILALVGVAAFFLFGWLLRGSAADALKRADSAYEQRSYETAANMYKDFATNWPTHESASYAKVRRALSLLRKEAEGAPNPVQGLRTAEQLLPDLIGESSLLEQQSDLAGVLVALAEKFTVRIDGTSGSDDRKLLMDEMEKLMALINDPQFVGSGQRTQLAPTLQRIEESRSRLRREIQRDEELVQASQRMDALLAEKDVVQMYELRRQLINRYPLLESHDLVKERVLRASAIQRDLVQNGSIEVRLDAPPAVAGPARTFLLTHQSGQPVDALQGRLVYLRIKGAVYAIDARTGSVAWRKHLGDSLDSLPLRLDDAADSDVLVAELEAARLHRLSAESGQSQWTATFSEPIHQPVIETDDLLVASPAGHLVSLDAPSGQVRWSKRLPQPLDVAPGVVFNHRYLYQPANHSNVYVIDRQDGTCREVYYLGHRAGAIQVPPVALLGQLLIVENINQDSARIRILAMTDQGLQPSQPAIPIDGNVLTPLVIDRRQVLVQSDLGNTLVLDIEPSAPGEKVIVSARVPRNVDTPQTYWAAFQQSKVWLAEKRLARFDLIVSQGKLNRRWIQYEGDEFVAPLQLLDGILIHARRQRGTQGVVVSAVHAEEGAGVWEVQLAEPLTVLTRGQGDRYDAVTRTGNYFSLVANQPTSRRADATAGEGKPLKDFADPVWLSSGQAVLLNRSNPREYALFSPTGNDRLRGMTVVLGSARPTGDAVAVDDRVVVGLENGQLVMFDPLTGALIGAPFQAGAARPGERISWHRPVFLPSGRALFAANDARQLFRLTTDESLRALVEEPLEHPLVGPLAIFGSRVAAVQSANAHDQLVLFDATSLQLTEQFPLQGRWVAGPFGTAAGGLVQTDRGLVAWDAAGNPQWSIDLPTGPLVDAPAIAGGNYIMATRDGKLWVVEMTTGQILGSSDVGQPLSTPPLVLSRSLLVGSDQGAVLAVPIPSDHSPSER